METYMTYLGINSIEFEMTLQDAQTCSHMGSCDNDVQNVSQYDYIRKQLNDINTEDMRESIADYGVEDTENMDRVTLESYVVWLAAGNICEDYNEENRH